MIVIQLLLFFLNWLFCTMDCKTVLIFFIIVPLLFYACFL
jgi:hypothetical protein